MDATSGRHAALMTDGRRRALTRALFAAALATGLLAATAGSAVAATCTGAGAVQNKSYTVVHAANPLVEIHMVDLTGHIGEGDTISASFTTDCATPVQVTLVSYYAPGATFDRSTAYRQRIATYSSGTFSAGTHTSALTVVTPPCQFQIDLVQGEAIQKFGYGPGGEGFYSDQLRLVDAANGGTHACPTPPLGPVE